MGNNQLVGSSTAGGSGATIALRQQQQQPQVHNIPQHQQSQTSHSSSSKQKKSKDHFNCSNCEHINADINYSKCCIHNIHNFDKSSKEQNTMDASRIYNIYEEPSSLFADPISTAREECSLKRHNSARLANCNHNAAARNTHEHELILAHLQEKYPSYRILPRKWSFNARNTAAPTTVPATTVQNSQPIRGQTNAPSASHSSHPPHPTLRQNIPIQSQVQNMLSHPVNAVSSTLFDDDPGIMSEVETSATGFRRSIKARSSLPIVRTPSKTQDRSLGLVFLQYRNETKRALLPNEITSMDTVKALFVRSFPKQLTMDYLDSRLVRIYIHDAAKDMFYELEDLRDIRDRSVLRIYEQDVANGVWMPVGGGNPVPPQSQWMDNDPSYFSEPEFDSEYQNQHIHRARKNGSPANSVQSQYYGTVLMTPPYRGQTRNIVPTPPRGMIANPPPQPPERTKPFPGYSQTLPRGTHLMAAYGNLSDSTQMPNTSNAQQNVQRPVSPDLIAKRPKDQIGLSQGPGAPPKPQRSFQSMMTPIPPSRAPPTGVVSRVIQSPQSTNAIPQSPNHAPPYHNRPLPERPYSVAGHYPSPERRSYQDYSGYLSSPERRLPGGDSLGSGGRSSFPPPGYPMSYDDMYGNYGLRSGNTTPVIDEEARLRMEYMERQLVSLTGLVQKALNTPQQSLPQSRMGPTGTDQRDDRLYANLNNLNAANGEVRSNSSFADDAVNSDKRKAPILQIDKQNQMRHLLKGRQFNSLTPTSIPSKYFSSDRVFSCSEDKSVSFSEDVIDSSPTADRMHSPLHAAEKPAKPAIKTRSSPASTSSGACDKPGKPPPPPKPASLVGYRGSADGSSIVGSLHLSAEMFNQLRQLRKKTKDLRLEVRNLRRMAQSQATIARDTLKESCLKIKASLAFMNIADPVERQMRFERLKLCRDEESYRCDVNRLEKDLNELESQVEELRSNVINRRCRVNMSDVESMALVLSRASKTVADLKARYPHLQETLKAIMTQEMECIVREEKFLKNEPERLESALRRCKKLTGTLVTLKRLASVQEQRSTGAQQVGLEKCVSADTGQDLASKESSGATRSVEGEPHMVIQVTPATPTLKTDPRHENALDALLDELQTFSKPPQDGQKRKFGSFDSAKKPGIKLRSFQVFLIRLTLSLLSLTNAVPLPPPRSSSRITDPQEQARQLMLLSSLTAAAALANSRAAGHPPAVIRSNSEPTPLQLQQLRPRSTPPEIKSGSTESVDSQEGNPFAVVPSNSTTSLSSVDSQGSVIENGKGGKSRQQVLEERHQELLKKQKLLQEQYTRLQLLSRGQIPKTLLNDLKKTGSESNILSKSSLMMTTVSGSLTHLAANNKQEKKNEESEEVEQQETKNKEVNTKPSGNQIKHETQKIYETDIL
ncbi:coiled-coil domain-containing protein CG32809-like isoform X14 [Dinothrombium tinctorium]|uniref:Coiled-coil domain-containing protein CG32809-like isoform X14 n=1 Tax=Dinothrombium tinctorium TaxID=1965070 RepID=A0A3S3PER9_9ACAR|nr:coiled-coil domain-containing protein CG32809-like isoform X14 [Dinothrombium tinctorium]RWS13796.1 coiled-coil domain-containing protein CG32809-like isoform X14 [Dinothrombium tinctorium]